MSLPMVITTTFENQADAEAMARQLLKKRLVACAQISGPVSSLYWWHGEIASAAEYLLVMKSDEAHYSEVHEAIQQSHPYETPEIMATVVSRCSKGYQQWLAGELRS